MTAEWGWPSLEAFDGLPNCTGRGADRSAAHLEQDPSTRAFYRVQGDATGYPLIGRATDSVQLTSETAHRVMSCGMWPQIDRLDEGRAAATRGHIFNVL